MSPPMITMVCVGVFAALHAAMLLFTSNWILVLEDVRGLCCEYETDLLMDMLSFGQKTSLKGMTKGKRFLAETQI